MGAAQTLLASITTAIGTHLGGTYGEIDYALDISKNQEFKSAKKYGVKPGAFQEVRGTVGAPTYEQEFHFVLTESYTEKTGDKTAREKAAETQDKAKGVYNHLVTVKCGSAIVRIVKNLSAKDPVFSNDGKIVSVESTFTVQYRE